MFAGAATGALRSSRLQQKIKEENAFVNIVENVTDVIECREKLIMQEVTSNPQNTGDFLQTQSTKDF